MNEQEKRDQMNREDVMRFIAKQKDRLQEWIDASRPDELCWDSVVGFMITTTEVHDNQPWPVMRLSTLAGRTIASCELTPETTVGMLVAIGWNLEQLQKEVIGVLLEMHQREAALIKSIYDSMIGKPKEMCGP